VETPLAPLFLAHTPVGVDGDAEVLEPLLLGLLAAGRAAWPALPIQPEVFARHLATLCPAGGEPQSFLLSVNYPEDLYLACACAQGSDAALRAFDELYLGRVAAFVPARETTPAALAELVQELRLRLLLARDGAPPRIATYTGLGSLLSWVRTAAVRTHLNLMRRPGGAGAHVGLEREAAALCHLAGDDPELAYIKGRYREEFKAAFQDALAVLTPEQRTILYLYYVEGLPLQRIAPLFQVHRATANRWLLDAREQIQREVRRLLHERLGVSSQELDSLAGLVRSQLNLSLPRVLKGK
jgi:RNA polymerase sigma-70 factor (ECF subfamily)